jgi:hypothetical protein
MLQIRITLNALYFIFNYIQNIRLNLTIIEFKFPASFCHRPVGTSWYQSFNIIINK